MSEPTVLDTSQSQLADGVLQGNIPTLLMVLVHLTGDLKWLEAPYAPRRGAGVSDNDTGGLPTEIQAEIQGAALDAIEAWRMGVPPALDGCSDELLVRMLSVAMGEDVPQSYGPMIAYDLFARESHDDGLAESTVNIPRGFEVLIIGAGVSGICNAIKFKEAGIPFRIIEQNAEIGGTWLVSRYPGCGVDTPNHLYSFSFSAFDWPQYFALQSDLLDYLRVIVDRYDLREHIEFNTHVLSAAYNQAEQTWVVEVEQSGSPDTLRANVVVSAVGALTKASWPEIPGLADFEGELLHTSDWADDADLADKRVGVIGTGASSMQLVPAVLPEVASLTIFQRSAQWAAPFEQFHKAVPQAVRQLLTEVPLYQKWYRIRLMWTHNDRIHDSLQIDPDWAHPERAVNAMNDRHREFFTKHIDSELGADSERLLEKALPQYPPFGKRMLLDNGWFRALKDSRVALVTEPISSATQNGLVTADSKKHELDVVICATGYNATNFLHSLDVIGIDGQHLKDLWGHDDARAYLGTTVPGFPNLLIQWGPNRSLGHGGSAVQMAEMNAAYSVSLVRQMLAKGLGSVDCRQEVFDEYNQRVDGAHDRMIWSHSGFGTWFRNSAGRVVVPSPFKAVDWWEVSRHADLDDFNSEPLASEYESVVKL